jgi:Icc-related predicted phosphoesterase
MRVAAVYDVHGNLPALEAVLQEIRLAKADLVVVGGDVLPGPMPGESLTRLLDLGSSVQFILGNGDREVLRGHGERRGAQDAYCLGRREC